MAKIKVKRKSTWVDMTAMCDVAFLLLTFFMLTSNFTRKEVVQIATPSSISEIKIPETNIFEIFIDNDGKVFIGIDGQDNRVRMLNKIGEIYNIKFDNAELTEFSKIMNFGVPIEKLKWFLSLKSDVHDYKENALGIPADTTDNQFKSWVIAAKTANPNLRIAIKADRKTMYPAAKKVIETLRDLHENRYNLITSLEEDPTKKLTF